MRDVLIGQTDYTVLVKIIGTDGAPETGLTEASIDIAYSRVETDNDVTTTDVAPASLSALTDAHTDWGFEEVSATDHPGLYRLDIADAVFATGAWEAVVTITDASGTDFYAVDIGFRLVAFNTQDGVRLGLTALANAAAGASGGIPINGSNSGTMTLAALTVTGELTVSDGIVVTCSTSGKTGMTVTGNGTGKGVTLVAGGSATSGSGLTTSSGITIGAGTVTLTSLTLTNPVSANAIQFSGSATAADNAEVVFATDFATNYDTTNDRWKVDAVAIDGGSDTDLVTAIADGVWDEALSGHTTSGTAGERLGRIPNIAAGSAGGVMIAGSNAATTFASLTVTGELTISNGVVISCSTSNKTAMTITGDGTGKGIVSMGGILSEAGSGFEGDVNITSGSIVVNQAQFGTFVVSAANIRAAVGLATNDLDTQLDAILEDTAEIGTAGAGLTNINLPNQTMDIVGNITGNLSGSVGSVTSGVTVTTNNDKTGYTLSATGSAAMTEGYGTDGSALTLPQAIYLILAHVGEFAISGTTKTLKKLDGTTTAAAYTLDDDATPTSITRAS